MIVTQKMVTKYFKLFYKMTNAINKKNHEAIDKLNSEIRPLAEALIEGGFIKEDVYDYNVVVDRKEYV